MGKPFSAKNFAFVTYRHAGLVILLPYIKSFALVLA